MDNENPIVTVLLTLRACFTPSSCIASAYESNRPMDSVHSSGKNVADPLVLDKH